MNSFKNNWLDDVFGSVLLVLFAVAGLIGVTLLAGFAFVLRLTSSDQ